MKMLTDVRYVEYMTFYLNHIHMHLPRSVVNPAHIVDFDEMVSPLEVQALHRSDSESSEDGK